jgi:hypothetical protein
MHQSLTRVTGAVSGARVFFASQRPTSVPAVLAAYLQGALWLRGDGDQHHLADRVALRADLERVSMVAVLLGELKPSLERRGAGRRRGRWSATSADRDRPCRRGGRWPVWFASWLITRRRASRLPATGQQGDEQDQSSGSDEPEPEPIEMSSGRAQCND